MFINPKKELGTLMRYAGLLIGDFFRPESAKKGSVVLMKTDGDKAVVVFGKFNNATVGERAYASTENEKVILIYRSPKKDYL